jgi:signal transduction histidine kinase/FixJ family two-component response regulator
MARILVVDDDPTARDLLRTVLRYAHHEVLEASDGTEGLLLVRDSHPDLIIADLLMPTMDGFEFVRRLREQGSMARTPVMFYTATYLEREASNLARACGVTQILSKPSDPEVILEAISRQLGTPAIGVVPPPAEEFHQKHLGLLLAKLASQANQVVPRLDAMIDFGLDLASERDPQRLLSGLCGAARKLVGTRYAVIGLIDENAKMVHYRFASGMSREVASSLTSVPLPRMLATALSTREPQRLSDLAGDPTIAGLPPEHPPVHSLLLAPILSPDHIFGWTFLTEKLGAPTFSQEDQGLVQILAAQAGRVYENASLYRDLARSLEMLKIEVEERNNAEAEVQKLNRHLEERVRERTAQLAAANQELEAFAYSVSHDLSAPLRHIQGYASLLEKSAEVALSEETRHSLAVISNSARQMGQLIEDLLTFSRTTAQPMRCSEVDLRVLAEEIISELAPDALKRSIEWGMQPLPRVTGDAALLRQVLINLLSNAVKYTRPRRRARIEIGEGPSSDRETIIFVRDNGVGFDMAYADKLFGTFQRLHSSSEFEGNGIGLANVRRIIARHGGRTWAEGKVDQGATVYFALPKKINPGDEHG